MKFRRSDSGAAGGLYSGDKEGFFFSPRLLSQKKLLVFVLMVVIGYFGIVMFIMPQDTNYIVVIDAGSSGSRAHVFHYKNGVVDPKHESLKSKPGLSSYASKPTEAGASLQPLVDFAKKNIPVEKQASTKILLKGTAGLRLLTEKERDDIMTSVKSFLQTSGFTFSPHDAEVIEGSEEGLLGWMAANYLNKSPGAWGVLEMGGASVQVSLPIEGVADAVPADLKRKYHDPLTGKEGEVFTHSFLGLGMTNAREAANELLVKNSATQDPCLQTNYVPPPEKSALSGVESAIPHGDFDACLQLVSDALYKPYKDNQCSHPTGCFFNGLYAPSLDHGKFWAFENFFYAPSALGMKGVPGKIKISDLANAAKDNCAMDWKDMDAAYPKDDQPKELNENWCFGMTHLYAFLTQGLGFPPSHEIIVGNSVGDNGIDWALGAALQAVAKPPQRLRRTM